MTMEASAGAGQRSHSFSEVFNIVVLPELKIAVSLLWQLEVVKQKESQARID